MVEFGRGKWGKAVKLLCFSLVFFLILGTTCWIFEKKDSIIKRKSFYEKEQNIDVLFLGTSLVINGVFPMELWNNNGIAAYNYAGHAELIPVNYWNLKNALNYTTPKLVVIDVFQLAAETKVYEDDMSYLHMSIDAMPFSKTKIDAVNDLVPEGYGKFEYLFDFALYHSRWEELSNSDIKVAYNISNGAESRIGTVYSDNPELVGEDDYIALDTYGTQYLEKIIQLCQKNEIEVLLINLPYSANNQQKTNYAKIIADKYSINFCNMMQEENIINYATDLCDGSFHMNPSGAVKVSEYLGKYICENYDIPDRRLDENYASWEKEYQNYRDNVEYQLLRNCHSNLCNYLTLLYDKNLEYYLYVDNEQLLLKEEGVMNLLKNLNIIVDEVDANSAMTQIAIHSDKLQVEEWEQYEEKIDSGYDMQVLSYDSESGALVDCVGFKQGEDGSFIGEKLEPAEIE